MKKLIRVLLILLVVVGLSFGVKLLVNKEPEVVITRTDAYIASDLNPVQLYHGEETIEKNLFGKVKSRTIDFTEDITVKRGDKVTLLDTPELDEEGNITYQKIEIGEETYYVKPEHIVDKYEDILFEKEKFVRTSLTLYESPDDAKIAGYVKKGTTLEVLGFDNLRDDSTVEMYKVKADDQVGYAFSKYLVDDLESAKAVYNEVINDWGVADYHSDAVYSFELYGGDPNKLDWYPYEKPEFENNPINKDVRAMYLGVGCTSVIDQYIKCCKAYGINTIVVDVLDDIIGFDCDIAKEISPTAYKNTYYDAEHYGDMIKAIKDAGIYVIGRIVCFNDANYAKDHPEDCINVYGDLWPSAYSRDVWYYKVQMAIEAVRKFGFNEIQFDYVRFPESSYSLSKNGADFKNTYKEDKAEAVQNFVFYACDMIHREGAYVNIDVFGESSYGYVTAYGQYWPAISNICDAISGMPYTDHFESNIPSRWEDPYTTVKNWAWGAAKLNKHIPTPAIGRTWVTAWDTPYWNPTTHYGANELAAQAQGLVDAGLTGGFMTWNVLNNLNLYYEFSWAWAKDYH